MTSRSRTPRISLDGLQWSRGVAALLVVLGHAYSHPLSETPSFARLLGEVGVSLFFVISGFIMVLTTGTGPFDIGLFVRRRLIRIVPTYYLATILTAAIAISVPEVMKTTRFDGGHFFMSLLFIPSYEPGTGNLLPIYKLGWTLNYEMFFYAVFAALGWATVGLRAIVILGGFAALSIAGQLVAFESAPAVFYTRFDVVAFAAGVAIGWLKLRQNWSLPMPATVVGVLLGIVCFVFVSVVYHEMRLSLTGFILVITGSSLIVAVLAADTVRGSGPVSRLLVLLGDASYTLYLFHIFVVSAVWWVSQRVMGDLTATPVLYGMAVFVAVIGSILLSVALHVLVERPITGKLNAIFAARPRHSLPPGSDKLVATPSVAKPNAELEQS